MARPQMRWEDQVKLVLGSGGEEWMNIRNEKIWEDRARWKRLCSVILYAIEGPSTELQHQLDTHVHQDETTTLEKFHKLSWCWRHLYSKVSSVIKWLCFWAHILGVY
jgi:hypothetical protein